MLEICVSVALTRKIRDGSGVLVERLAGIERVKTIVRLRDLSPILALVVADGAARARGEFAKIFGPHRVIVARLETAGAIRFTSEP